MVKFSIYLNRRVFVMSEVQGDVLRPPQALTPALVKKEVAFERKEHINETETAELEVSSFPGQTS